MSMRAWLMSLALPALVVGCAAPPVPPPEPTEPPEAWSFAPNTTQQPTNPSHQPPDERWWRALNDEDLNRIIEAVLTRNADLHAAEARLRQARAMVRTTQADRKWQLDASVSAAHERVPGSTVEDANGRPVTLPPDRNSRYGLTLEARYEFDWLGRLGLEARAAQAEQQASAADKQGLRQWLVHETLQAYAEYRLHQQRATLARRSEALLTQALRMQGEKLSAGLIAQHEWLEAERQLAHSRDHLRDVQSQRQNTQVRLAVLLDQAPDATELTTHARYFEQLDMTGVLPPRLPAEVIGRRADVAAAWQRVQSAYLEARATRLERFPSLTLTGRSGLVSESLARWLTTTALDWLFQAAVHGSVFDGGMHEARTHHAVAEMDERHAMYRKTVVSALAEVEIALSTTQAQRERVASAEAEQRRCIAEQESARAQLVAGLLGRAELLQAQLALLEADQQVLQSRYELLGAQAKAQFALGG
ncbi:efflux transporter outer membrane subunit [Hydrogenophaga sp. 5NK40-0174]|uniref:efflux transporter outer membrane subunit n=1 Tax=Hydrogenophaga sp. 5NK40-0174 TaxID=3127649 RepID=UPI00310C02C4